MMKHYRVEVTLPDSLGHQALIRVTGDVECESRAVENIRAFDKTDDGDPYTNIASKYDAKKLRAILFRAAGCPED